MPSKKSTRKPVSIRDLIIQEDWEIVKGENNEDNVIVYDYEFPLTHPFNIHCKLQRVLGSPELKYQHFIKIHHMLFPNRVATYNYWEERIFREVCDGAEQVNLAGGANLGKSDLAARLAWCFWGIYPKDRGALVFSTTLESLDSRIWGYIKNFGGKLGFPIPHTINKQPAQILWNRSDTINCMKAIATSRGLDEEAIKNLIGRHPEKGLLVILDEAPDIDAVILKAVPNWEQKADRIEKPFLLVSIGNSKSKNDLHGALSTPRDGWGSVSTETTKWNTNHINGVTLYFNPYESPAILEANEERRKLLTHLPTELSINQAILKYGKTSPDFMRMTMGFWVLDKSDDVILSEAFLKESDVSNRVHYGGIRPIFFCAGLDPAFSTGGDKCLLRIGIIGEDVYGNVVLDLQDGATLHHIKITANGGSIETQISDAVIPILKKYNIELSAVAIDATGQGRGLGEIIRMRMGTVASPIKIYSIGAPTGTQRRAQDVTIKSSYDLWNDVKMFMSSGQLKGLDKTATSQFANRLVVKKNGKETLESKLSYKQRMSAINPILSHSPDEADTVALVLQAAIMRFGFKLQQKREVPKFDGYYVEKMMAHNAAQAEAEVQAKKRIIPSANFSGDLESYVGSRKLF